VLDKTGSLPVSFPVQIIYRIVSYRIVSRLVCYYFIQCSIFDIMLRLKLWLIKGVLIVVIAIGMMATMCCCWVCLTLRYLCNPAVISLLK